MWGGPGTAEPRQGPGCRAARGGLLAEGTPKLDLQAGKKQARGTQEEAGMSAAGGRLVPRTGGEDVRAIDREGRKLRGRESH